MGFNWWDRTTLHSGGPVSGGAGINGQLLGVGEGTSFGGFVLTNEGKEAAVLEDVRVVGVTGGFQVLDVRTSPVPFRPAAEGEPENQPDGGRDSLADSHMVPVAKKRSASSAPDEGLRLIFRARAARPGVARARGVEFTYRIGHRRYRRSSDSSMYLCAPKERFPGHSCPGDAAGQFGDAVADFPVR
jgi:hypothetical protein